MQDRKFNLISDLPLKLNKTHTSSLNRNYFETQNLLNLFKVIKK